MIRTNSWTETVFQTTARSRATFKEELLVPRKTLIKSRLVKHFVVSDWQFLVGECLPVRAQ